MGGGTGASLIKGWAGIPESYVTQVPVLTLDRILGDALQGKKSLIIVDVEGAEYAMMQGAMKTLRHNPKPIWMMEIGSNSHPNAHQPKGVARNPHLLPTFNLFFEHGYTAKTADMLLTPVDSEYVHAVADGHAEFITHNFIFR